MTSTATAQLESTPLISREQAWDAEVVGVRPAARIDGACSPRVLIVDDDADGRDWLRQRLTLEGWTVEETASGDEAVERCHRTSPDAVIVGQRTHGMSGLQCAAELRKESSRTRIFFIADLDESTSKEARRLQLLPLAKADHEIHLELFTVLADQIRSSKRSGA